MHPVPQPERTSGETEAQEEGLASSESGDSETFDNVLTFIDVY